MSNKTVAERLRGLDENKAPCPGSLFSTILNGEPVPWEECRKSTCRDCKRAYYDKLAEAVEAEQAELREKSEFERDASRKERDRLCKGIEELECKASEYKRMLDFRKELEDKTIVFNGLRDLANTSKFHQNSEWKKIVGRLTKNAEDYANRALAEARAKAEEEKRVDLAALDLLCEKLEMSSEHMGIAAQIREATSGAERPHEVDVKALRKVAEEMEDYFAVPPYKMLKASSETISRWENDIVLAIEGVFFEDTEHQLPEGIIWPRFEDGELVKFGDEINVEGVTESVTYIGFYETHVCVTTNAGSYEGYYKFKHGEPLKRPEPEVLDADGVPVKVGDTVYIAGSYSQCVVTAIDAKDEWKRVLCDDDSWHHNSVLTHRKPDTFESVVGEMLADFDGSDSIELDGYFDRLRKLMGGDAR